MVPSTAPAIDQVVENLTARRIAIAPKSSPADADLEDALEAIVIPPFGRRVIRKDLYPHYHFAPWESRNLVTVQDQEQIAGEQQSALIALGLLVWMGLLFLPLGFMIDSAWYWWGWSVISFALLLVAVTKGGIIKTLRHFLTHTVPEATRNTIRWLGIACVTVVGFSVPAVLVGEQLSELEGRVNDLATLFLALFVLFIGLLSILPALLYFLFDHQQKASVRNNFFREVLRLDPALQTRADAETLYGPLLDDVYGGRSQVGLVFSLSGLPVLISTLLMTMGWTITLLPTLNDILGRIDPADDLALYSFFLPHQTVFSFGFLGVYFFTLNMVFRRYVRADLGPKAYSHITMRIVIAVVLVWVAGAVPNATTEVPLPGAPTAAVPMRPGPDTEGTASEDSPAAGAAGEAAFQEGVAVQGEAAPQGEDAPQEEDAPPGAADGAPPASPLQAADLPAGGVPTTTRPDFWLLLLAFSIGVIPETGMAFLHNAIQRQQGLFGKTLAKLFATHEEQHPLSKLEGITLYDRARLLEEGIENIENLAHHNIIELMLRTRIPTTRLVDLIDQAILYLHTWDRIGEGVAGEDQGDTTLRRLRRYGIRTATDLETAFAAAQEREKVRPGEVEAFLRLFETEEPAPADAAARPHTWRMRVILDTVKDDEWMTHLRHWRDCQRHYDDVFTLDRMNMQRRDAARQQEQAARRRQRLTLRRRQRPVARLVLPDVEPLVLPPQQAPDVEVRPSRHNLS